ncbi:AAA family ATPase [Sulfitobacter sp. BDSS02]|nr:AAA family ATPase [Sulfitobacter sp. BDSS02]MBR9848220.1 AAA family ATPase [Paracoccaceae bacterium]
MSRIKVNLLGEFELWRGDTRLRLPTRRAELLVALLALSPGLVHSRERLSTLFWPGRDEEQARTSLRQAVYQIRRSLGADKGILQTDIRFVGLDPEGFDSDVAQLLAPVETEIETIWRGDFLAGHDPREEALEAWLTEERARLRSLALEKAQARAQALIDRHRFVEAETVARRCLTVDPYDELSSRIVMLACARQGRRNAAIATYRDLADRLRTELATAPEQETTDLFQSIRAGQDSPADVPAPPAETEAPPATKPAAPPPDDPPQFERRVATALSLALPAPALDVDPELAQELDSSWYAEMTALIDRHSGRVVHADASGLTCLFGLSGTAENHAVNAGKAALALLEINQDAALAAHSGLVVTPARGAQAPDNPFLGPVAMTARALAATVPLGQCLFSAAARLGAEGWFEFADLAPVTVPGLSGPLPVSALKGETDARTGWDVLASRNLSPFQGRAIEVAVLGDLLKRASTHAQVALLSGLPGIGKSRLAHEFQRRLPPGTRTLRLGLTAHDVDFTYRLPEMLVREWRSGLAQNGLPDLPEALPDLVRTGVSVLSGDGRTGADWTALGPSQQIHCIVETIGYILADIAQDDMLVLVLEDLHWIDSASREVLAQLVGTLGAARLLLLGTARPEFQPDWSTRSHVHVLMLDELEQSQAEALIAAHIGDAPEHADIRRALASHAGRIPLFIEEVLRELQAKGDLVPGYDGHIVTRPLEDLDVPITVRGVIAARVDRLDNAPRALLQAFSVLGTEVSETHLEALADMPATQFRDALQALTSAEMLYRGRRPGEWYIRHALIRDVVYQSILRGTRKVLHEKAVGILSGDQDTASDTMAGTLARHALLGEQWQTAAKYARIAGDRAHDLSIFQAARRHYNDAIVALNNLPASEDTLRTGIETRIRLRPALMLLGERQELERVLGEAEDMAQQIGDPGLFGRVLLHRSYAESTLGLVRESLSTASRCAAQAELCGDPYLAAEARLARGQAFRVQCAATSAIDTLEPDLTYWTRDNRMVRGDHLGTRAVWYLGHLGAVYALSGRFDQAHDCVNEAIRIADESARPADRQHARFSRAEIHLLQGALDEAQRDTERADAIFQASTIWRTGTKAEIFLATGEVNRAMDLLRRVEARAAELGQDYVLHSQVAVALAEGLLLQGHTDEAQARALKLLLPIQAQSLYRHELRLRIVLSRIALAAKENTQALEQATVALTLADTHGLAPDESRIRALLAEIEGSEKTSRLSA